MKWISVHPKISALTIIIVILFIFIFASSKLGKLDNPVGRAAGNVLATIQMPFKAGLDWVQVRIAAALTDEALRAENERLKAEAILLEEELALNRLSEAELRELRELKGALSAFGAPQEGYTLKTASILAFEGSSVFNVFTIDAGTEEGSDRDAVVINGDGLVGRVIEAGKNSSKIVCIIDENNKVGFEVEGKPSGLGVCYGNGTGGLQGNMLDDRADVKPGDRIITSGLGGIYPAGILIGVVTEAEYIKESSLLHVEIEPAVEFKSIKKVALLL